MPPQYEYEHPLRRKQQNKMRCKSVSGTVNIYTTHDAQMAQPQKSKSLGYLLAGAAVSNDDRDCSRRITLHVQDASIFAAVDGTGMTWVSREAPVYVLNRVCHRGIVRAHSLGFPGHSCVCFKSCVS
jgi:glucose dehydrogenase